MGDQKRQETARDGAGESDAGRANNGQDFAIARSDGLLRATKVIQEYEDDGHQAYLTEACDRADLNGQSHAIHGEES